jgi:predicted deacylase
MTIKIYQSECRPGERKSILIPLPSLYHGEPLSMPTHVIHGKKDGPILLVMGAIHGDEINGTEIIRRLLSQKGFSDLSGTLICVPVVNVYGYIHQSRYLVDRRDLNRCFPGSASGSLGSRLAHLIVQELLLKASHVIDLHTGALHRSNFPQIRSSLNNQETRSLAHAFSAPVIIDSRQRDGSLRQMALDLKKPCLLYEVGEALRFEEMGIRLGVKGILNVMQHLGMLKTTGENKLSRPTIVSNTHWVRAGRSGNLLTKKKLGSIVKKGEVIGLISNPFDLSSTRIISPYKGIVIALSKLPAVHEGQALFHIGMLERPDASHIQLAELEDLIPSDVATFFPDGF